MSNKYEAKAIYDEMIHDVTTSEKKWQDVCRLTGQIYRFEFDNILMVYGQRPQSTIENCMKYCPICQSNHSSAEQIIDNGIMK